MIGYIKLHRQILHWEWYTDINTKTLFLHCLLLANHKDNLWRGMEIKTGTFVSSLRKLSVETGLTVSQIRTSLSKLESTQEIAQETHTSFTVIKVLNYANYQGSEKDTVAQEMHETSQSSSTPNRTPDSNKQEYKEIKNDKNKDIKEKNIKKEISYFNNLELNLIFNDFLNIRKKLRAVNSELAITKLLNKLDELSGGDDDLKYKIIEQSVIGSYKSVFPLKESNKFNNKQNGFKTKQQLKDERMNEQLERLAKERGLND